MPIDYTKRPTSSHSGSASPILLTKGAPTVSLTKHAQTGGTLCVNLNWNSRPPAAPAGGFLKRLSATVGPGIDLDLGCLYEFTDGSKGVVQALGGAFGDNPFGPSICWLDGDDRSGSNSAGENLYVDLDQAARIRRILVFAFIYEGVPNWSAADGVVTIRGGSGPEVVVSLDEHAPGKGMCGIAMFENRGSDLQVSREVRYFPGHQELDRAYGWGLNWRAGRK